MSAEFEIFKYTGKDCAFGTPVSSIGIKRIDAAVPAVYGVPIVPADDKTDANTYCIYRPDVPTDVGYSFESIFKFILKTPPSNQLSHMRIYPATTRPDDANIPILYIGCSTAYSRPTNDKSLVAINNIWNYTEESPFLVTVGGNFGQYLDEQVAVLDYNITEHDIGYGNVMYLNEDRQIPVPIVVGNTYTFVDKTDGDFTFQIFNALDDTPVTDPAIVITTNGLGERVVTVTANATLFASYPAGFKYGDASDITVGGLIGWLDLQVAVLDYNITEHDIGYGNVMYLNEERQIPVPIVVGNTYTFVDKTDGDFTFQIYNALDDTPVTNPAIVVTTNGLGERVVTVTASAALFASYPAGFKYGDASDLTVGGLIGWETVDYTVRVETLPNGSKCYYLNDIRTPTLNFETNRIYRFTNVSGDTDPIRFLTNKTSVIANVESEIVIQGVTVTNGGTVNEIVTVDPSAVLKSGKTIRGYQSVAHSCYGGEVTNVRTSMVGYYNINTVGGGVTNPLAAGETDYIFLQLAVTGDSTVGQAVPELVIEYDEN